jgi:hypothetical protein
LHQFAFFSYPVKDKSIVVSPDEYHAAENVTQIMIHDIFSPPVAVYPNIAAYEIIAQNSKTYKSLENQLAGLGFKVRPKSRSEY